MLAAIPTEYTLSPHSGETDSASKVVEDHLPPLFQALLKVGFKLYISLVSSLRGTRCVLQTDLSKDNLIVVHVDILQLTR